MILVLLLVLNSLCCFFSLVDDETTTIMELHDDGDDNDNDEEDVCWFAVADLLSTLSLLSQGIDEGECIEKVWRMVWYVPVGCCSSQQTKRSTRRWLTSRSSKIASFKEKEYTSLVDYDVIVPVE